MTLPLPQFTAIGLGDYLANTPIAMALPPGPPSEWTTLLHLLGLSALRARSDSDQEVFSDDVVRAMARKAGRAVLPDEQPVLLLVSPIPASTRLSDLVRPLLSDSSWSVRSKAALVLGAIGDVAQVKVLIRALSDDDNDVRRCAAEALGRLGSPEAIPALAAKGWGDSDSAVDAARVRALARLDDWALAAEHLAEDEDESAFLAVQAILEAEAQGSLGPVLDLLEDAEEAMRLALTEYVISRPERAATEGETLARRALDAGMDNVTLARLAGAGGAEAGEVLLEQLASGGWSERMYAAIALGYTGSQEVVEALKEALVDDDSDVRREAALALLRLGHPGPSAAILAKETSTSYDYPARATELSGQSPSLRALALATGRAPVDERVLLAIGDKKLDDDSRGIACLLAALHFPREGQGLLEAVARDDSRDVPLKVRRHAAAGLLLTGTPPRALGALHRVLLCHEGEVSGYPKGSVTPLYGHEGALAFLAGKDGDWPVRLDALRLLSAVGAAEDYVELLQHISRFDPDSDCRAQARSLLPITWAQRDLSDVLAQALFPTKQEDAEKTAAMQELAQLRPDLVLPLAERQLLSEERDAARASAKLIASLPADEAIAALLRERALPALADSSWITREAAAELLGMVDLAKLDEELHELAVEALRERQEEDDDSDVREAAEAALKALGGGL
ncbi:MAG: HEAT repeat domain-containing protein [Deltaproteobacteria bacterium]|nr:HEAT repeat domain-containing protein [Deltaproteobacteria bacterium]